MHTPRNIATNEPNNEQIDQWTAAIFSRLTAQWEGWKNHDPAPNDSIIANDFQSVSPDGIHRFGKPTMQQMQEQSITAYKLSEFRVVPVSADSALVTYFADIETPGDLKFHMAVGEFWFTRNGQWMIRAFSGTLTK